MNNQIIDHLTNPTRARIFFEIYIRGQLTVKDLLAKFTDISQPTIYRHIKALVDDNIIKVSGEKQIRGAVEKSYTVNEDTGADIARIIEENDSKGYFQLFMQFITNVMKEFKFYSETENINIIEDASGFSIAPVYATKDEIYEAMLKISEIIMPLMANEPTPQRKLRSVCIITTPPK